MIGRREFMTLAGGAVAWPFELRAQQSQLPVIGYFGLATADAEGYMLAAFRRGLSEAGYEDGRNILIDSRFANRDIARLPAIAAEFVDRRAAVVFTGTSVASLAIKAATSTIPIVFAVGTDPIQLGLVAGLNRPGGNATGISFFTNQMESKRLGLLHELVPKADLIAAILNPKNPFFENQSRDLAEASRALGVKVQIEPASNPQEVAKAFETFAREQAKALLVGADPFFNSQRKLVIDPAVELRLPAIYEWREFVEAGGLMSYGTSLTSSYRQAGDFVARILKGANPADMPVVQATKFEFVINAKTAKKIGVSISDNMVSLADEVIE